MRALVIPRLITFDVTGTLLMTKLEQHYDAVARSHGLPGLDGSRVVKTFKESFKRLEKEHPIYGRVTGFGWQNWWRCLIYDVFRDQHKDISKKKLDEIANSLIECYSTSRCWHRYPGTLELLESLRNKPNIVLGVISNFDERLDAVLKSARIRSYFSFVLTSYSFGIEKPSPAIFQEALRISSANLDVSIKPEEALHIGDRIDKDYLGAQSAQWNTILINRENENLDEKIVQLENVFKNFDDLKVHFDKMF